MFFFKKNNEVELSYLLLGAIKIDSDKASAQILHQSQLFHLVHAIFSENEGFFGFLIVLLQVKKLEIGLYSAAVDFNSDLEERNFVFLGRIPNDFSHFYGCPGPLLDGLVLDRGRLLSAQESIHCVLGIGWVGLASATKELREKHFDC